MKWRSNCCGATLIYGNYDAEFKQEIGMCNKCKEYCGSYDEDAMEEVIDQETQLHNGTTEKSIPTPSNGTDTKSS